MHEIYQELVFSLFIDLGCEYSCNGVKFCDKNKSKQQLLVNVETQDKHKFNCLSIIIALKLKLLLYF